MQKFGVVFDMDGVIINNNDWHVKSWLAFADRSQIDLKEEEFHTKVFGKTNEQILEIFFPDASWAQLQTWALEKEALYREMYRPYFKLADGLLDFLKQLKDKGIGIAVASNAPLVNIDFALDEGEIRPYFDAILYAGMVPNPKPAPDIYLKACELLGYPAQTCYVIEDSPPGLKAAVAAGCKAIAITSTFPKPELQLLTPRVIDHFAELGGDWWERF